MLKQLVITADDGFYDFSRDRDIVLCLKKETSVTDVSVIMNGRIARRLLSPDTDPVIYLSEPPLYEYMKTNNFVPGIHLNLTEGEPLSPVNSVKTLVDSMDQFLGKHGFRKQLSRSGDRVIDLEQVERELEKQLMSFRLLFNAPPSHADGHHHIHVLPELLPVFCRLLPRHDVRWVRIPEEHEAALATFTPAPVQERPDADLWRLIRDPRRTGTYNILEQTKESLEFYREVSRQASLARTIFYSIGLSSTNTFLGMTLMGRNLQPDRLKESLSRIEPGQSVELMTNPGYSYMFMGGGCGREGPDEFATSKDREHEVEVLCSSALADVINSANCRTVRFNELETRWY